MRICFLSSKHTPLDKRVFAKEAVGLAAAGHDVVHIAPATSDGGESLEHLGRVRQGVELLTFEPATGLVGRILRMPRLFRVARRVGADCYHCNEVDSWVVGLLLKAVAGSKVVFDVHEQYSAQFADDHCPRLLRLPVGSLLRLTFRLLATFTDRLVFARQGVASDFSGSPTRRVLVQNYASVTPPAAAAAGRPTPDPGDTDRVTAIHLGLLGRARGWPQLLEALTTESCRQLHLHVIGSFVDGSRDAFLRRCEELGLRRRIRIDDWMPYSEAYGRLCAADIGLVLFQPGTLNHVYALPHKLFDYMLAQLPVVVPGFAIEVAEIVRQADCGLLVDPADPEAIAAALARLAGDPAERRRQGRNGRRAVVERYNWEQELRKLVAMYSEIEREAERHGAAPLS